MFKISSRDGKKPHHHLLFITKDGIEVGEANKHTHAVSVQTTEVQIDPMSGMPVEMPLEQPIVIFSMEMEDDHTHEVGGEVELKVDKPKKETDEDKTSRMRKMFESARECARCLSQRVNTSVMLG